jgi:hypothetical protein
MYTYREKAEGAKKHSQNVAVVLQSRTPCYIRLAAQRQKDEDHLTSLTMSEDNDACRLTCADGSIQTEDCGQTDGHPEDWEGLADDDVEQPLGSNADADAHTTDAGGEDL